MVSLEAEFDSHGNLILSTIERNDAESRWEVLLWNSGSNYNVQKIINDTSGNSIMDLKFTKHAKHLIFKNVTGTYANVKLV